MSKTSKCCVFLLTITVIGLFSGCYWYITTRKDIKLSLANFRHRRTAQNDSTTISPQQLELTKALNRTQNREMENVLEVTLAKLLITCPEDLMTAFVTRENFGCKDLKRSLKVFSANYNGDLKSGLVYVRLFRSIGKFCQHFCGQDEKYRKIFTPWQDELMKLHEEFQDCQGRLDWYEKNSTFACIEANKIIECYHEALTFAINDKVVYHYIEVFKRVMNEALSTACKFNPLKLSLCEKEAAEERSIDWMLILIVVTVLAVFLLVCCMCRNKIAG